MHPNEVHSSFKITALLYLVVLMLGMGFYYIYTSFENMQQDTKIMYKSGWLRGIAEQTDNHTPKQVLSTLNQIEPWVQTHKGSTFYAGSVPLTTLLATAKSCWQNYKHAKPDEQQQCIRTTTDLENHISRIIYPEQQHMDNKLYILLIITLFAVLYLIYFIRLFIEHQINRHSVYDLETNLYNCNYLMEHLKTTCARAARYKYSLSLLSISFHGINKKDIDKKEYMKFMETMGDILLTITRTSDVACRYDESYIAIILPFTEVKNAEILRSRIQEILERHDFGIIPKPEFRFSITHYEPKETSKEYIERAKKVLLEN